MLYFDYVNRPSELLTAEIMSLVGNIREKKGRQELFIEAEPQILGSLLEVAKIQSTGASNRIEGIYTSDKRLKELVEKKAEPKNRSEEEISGYRDALTTIHENYDYIPINTNVILQLHRDLYSFSSAGMGGKYKNTDNVIAEILPDGTQSLRFKTLSAYETKQAMEELCAEFNAAMHEGKYDPLLLICMFSLDFLCIHPFNDGNGRMSRLLTLLLLYKSGYIVGKYISIEVLIEDSKYSYYEALQASSEGWHDGENSYEHFTRYMLAIILKAYNEFEKRMEHLRYRKLSKAERVEHIIKNSLKPISKSEILELAPDISQVTVERALVELQKRDIIQKIGSGRATKYIVK
ncbi:MAG: Fic family protein [Christensenellaceae bacterium]|nr:Fic family protein [Christensenellaceae bacterium]